MKSLEIMAYRLITESDWETLFALPWGDGYSRHLNMLRRFKQTGNNAAFVHGAVASINLKFKKLGTDFKVFINPSTGTHSVYVLEIEENLSPRLAFEAAVQKISYEDAEEVFRQALAQVNTILNKKGDHIFMSKK